MKVVFCSDHPSLKTAYGKCSRYAIEALVKCIGPSNLVVVGRTPNKYSIEYETDCRIVSCLNEEKDEYAQITLPRIINEFKPDIVITLGDFWMSDWVAKLPNKSKFKWMSWLPIDGAPIPASWIDTLKTVDMIACVTEWSKEVVYRKSPELLDTLFVLRHGVDNKIFYPVTSIEEKMEIKDKLGFKKEVPIIGCVARNCQRKNLPVLLAAFKKYLSSYVICNNRECPPTYHDEPKCGHCGGDVVWHKPPKDLTALYLHTEQNSKFGWDLDEMTYEMGLNQITTFPDSMTEAGMGDTEERLAMLYRAMDLFVMPTTAEGFCLPILEAMACGIPVIATDYSGHVEFASGSSILVPDTIRIRERITGMGRAIVSEDDLLAAMDLLYYNDPEEFMQKHIKELPWIEKQLDLIGVKEEKKWSRYTWKPPTGDELRKILSEKSVEVAKQLDWESIQERLCTLVESLHHDTSKPRVPTSYADVI